MKKAFRKITKAISITTSILLSNVFLAFSAFAEGGIGDAPSSVDTATYWLRLHRVLEMRTSVNAMVAYRYW